MEPLISKTPAAPLPRPLEQEQWNYEFVRDIILRGHSGYITLANRHNTSLRALQEELAAAKQRTEEAESALDGWMQKVYNLIDMKLKLLAACKAKDSLLREVMQWHGDKDSPDYNECDTDPCAWCEEAKATFQPDSSVKPEFQTSEGDKSITIRALP